MPPKDHVVRLEGFLDEEAENFTLKMLLEAEMGDEKSWFLRVPADLFKHLSGRFLALF